MHNYICRWNNVIELLRKFELNCEESSPERQDAKTTERPQADSTIPHPTSLRNLIIRKSRSSAFNISKFYIEQIENSQEQLSKKIIHLPFL